LPESDIAVGLRCEEVRVNVCLFCGESVAPVAAGRDLVWAAADGATMCTADGATGPHYPGREADLFWRGSEVVDLTADEAVLDLTRSVRAGAGRRSA
jgi:hypothetical protein